MKRRWLFGAHPLPLEYLRCFGCYFAMENDLCFPKEELKGDSEHFVFNCLTFKISIYEVKISIPIINSDGIIT